MGPPSNPEVLARARAEAQSILRRTPQFATMSAADQLSLYRNLVQGAVDRERHAQRALARGMAGPFGIGGLAGNLPFGIGGQGGQGEQAPRDPAVMGGLTSQEVMNPRIDNIAKQGADFINEIDFPQFVSDLLEGVFKSNIQVMMKQTEMYQKLLKTATESLAKFVQKIDDAAAFAYLVEKEPDNFSLGEDENERDEQGNPKVIVTDKEGNKLDVGDNELRARVMDAKIAMAKEHRAMLRETILMGITRLVVEKGVVEASVLFDVSATENIKKAGKSGNTWEKTTATESGGGGIFGFIFGGGDESTSQTRHAKISVSSVKSVADSKLAAQIKGNVKIHFKSDYFKLDNFAKLYEGGADGGAPLGRIPGSPALLPTGQPAPAAPQPPVNPVGPR